MLDGLVGHVVALLAQDPAGGDEALARLLPDGYRSDAESAAELRSLIQDDLVASKRAALETISAGLTARTGRGRLLLDEATAEQWLTGLNDVRLTLGTRLGVTEEMYDGADHGIDPDLLDVYTWLGWFQETLVEALWAEPQGAADGAERY